MDTDNITNKMSITNEDLLRASVIRSEIANYIKNIDFEDNVKIVKIHNLKRYLDLWYKQNSIKPDMVQFLDEICVLHEVERKFNKGRGIDETITFIKYKKEDNTCEVIDFVEDVIDYEYEDIYIVGYTE